MRRVPILILGMAIAALASAGAVFAFQASDRPARPSAATGSILGDMDGLDPLMARAEARGPYSLSCNSWRDESLACTPVADKDVIPALKRGETIYGRTVIGFPGGARAGEDEGPTFEPSDLICAAVAGDAMTCRSVTSMTPTVHAGQRTLSFYKRHNVTFNERGRPVGHLLAPTIALRVLP